jgi:hypothetical protein
VDGVGNRPLRAPHSHCTRLYTPWTARYLIIMANEVLLDSHSAGAKAQVLPLASREERLGNLPHSTQHRYHGTISGTEMPSIVRPRSSTSARAPIPLEARANGPVCLQISKCCATGGRAPSMSLAPKIPGYIWQMSHRLERLDAGTLTVISQ